MSDSESDIELKSALLKKKPNKPAPKSPSDDLKIKKITTKMMITDALIELKTRKGVSLYAIKKYLTDKYNVNTEKANYLIKKSIKAGVEDGTFIQMKGIGASGSFKLANVNDKPKTKKITKKPEKTVKPEAKREKTEAKIKKTVPDDKGKDAKKPKRMDIEKKEKGDEKKTKHKVEVKVPEKTSKEVEIKTKPKKNKVKITKDIQKPTKKRAAINKRKSLGSIIKPPKMKPA